MRRYLLPTVLGLTLFGVVAGAGQAVNSPGHGHITFTVSLIQEATIRHPHPPAGDAGDTFSTTLRLNALGNALGYPPGTPMGIMAFTWGPLNGSCSTNAASCSGTTNILTLTKLPGGTITANGLNVSLSKGIIVPIQSGTGIFKGVKGTIYIAPNDVAEDVFKIVMP
jgi:hypothetical protein